MLGRAEVVAPYCGPMLQGFSLLPQTVLVISEPLEPSACQPAAFGRGYAASAEFISSSTAA